MKKVLFMLHLPPPIHGVSQINTIIKNSTIINSNLECDYINIATANAISDLGTHRIGKYFQILKLIFSMIKHLISKKYDLIYITPSIPGIGFYKDSVFIFLAKLFRKKIICHLHIQGFQEDTQNRLKKQFYLSVFKGVKVVHLAESLYKDIETIVDKKNVYFIANGVVPVNELELQKKIDFKSDKFEILFLSNMIEFKGPFLLLEALVQLAKKYNDIHITFIGKWQDEEFKHKFLEYIKTHSLEKYIAILGGIYGPEKNQYFLKANIFVLPTRFEAFPLVLLEAMEFSLPVISTNEGAIPDIVDDKLTGFIIEKNNVSELIEKIEIIKKDKLLEEFLGRNARKKFEQNYSSTIMEQSICDTIVKVISNE